MSGLDLEKRLEIVEAKVAEACRRSGRSREDVSVIAVTKYISLEATGEVIRKGCTQIGESRWQDAEAKWRAYEGQATWHFIGHLQTNKVKEVVGRFQYIHSLDRHSLAKEIQKKAESMGITAQCFLQVNVSGEESKYGLSPDELFLFAEQLRAYPNLHIVGLMTMAPYELEAEETRPVFRGLRELRDELNRRAVLPYEVKHLSMGMSNDFEIAIEEGATWVRLGSILVGREGGE